MAEKIPSEEVDYLPVCPHCDKKIDVFAWRELEAWHAEYVFLCPHCHCVLGLGVRKGAWAD